VNPSTSHLESNPDRLRERLAALHAGFRSPADDPRLDAAISELSHGLDRILNEHAGMSAELLSVYEQLGVVFDVTRRMPTVDNEPAVVALFVDSLSRSFAGGEVVAVRPVTGGPIDSGLTDSRNTEWRVFAADLRNGASPTLRSIQTAAPDIPLSLEITRARNERRVIVVGATGFRLGDSDAPTGSGESIIGPVFAGDEFVCALVLSHGPALPAFRAADMLLAEALSTFCGDLIRNFRLMRELRHMSLVMVRALVNAVDQKDEYTSGHSIRVGFYATMLGKAVGLSDFDLQMLQWSALLHDVGKIGIRDDVLKKAARLTTDEFEHIKEHPIRSHQVVQQVPQLADALDGILHHHEHYDGSGYPHGLAGENIPLQARIIQIADVFDALTSCRSYRPAHSWEEALEILRKEAGKTVDPTLANRFDELMRGMLHGRPKGWETLIAQANRFSHESLPVVEEDDSWFRHGKERVT
jgi:HD-GYP domain-containing protein (c-di-GMP phosphodiesterase class II)